MLYQKAGIVNNKIVNKVLYKIIVEFRYKFSRVGSPNYKNHNPNAINPIPTVEKINDWKADYAK